MSFRCQAEINTGSTGNGDGSTGIMHRLPQPAVPHN